MNHKTIEQVKSMKPTLLILAAGMGSRYGGLKQVDKLGPSGETILEYSIYDAIKAGFGKVVFVIRKDIEEAFKEAFGGKFDDKIKVEYVFQELDKLPEGFSLNPNRKKPWGTSHAVLMAKDVINEPFAVINADDFYGADAFKTVATFFDSLCGETNIFSMVGYKVSNTLSEHGTVSRGICSTDSDNNLTTVVERTDIKKEGDQIIFIDENKKVRPLTGNEIVSMNFWGFTPSYFAYAEEQFKAFLKERGDEEKSEFYIPTVVNNCIVSGEANTKVLQSSAKWFGVTYKEDKQSTIDKIAALVKEGVYPENLWA